MDAAIDLEIKNEIARTVCDAVKELGHSNGPFDDTAVLLSLHDLRNILDRFELREQSFPDN